MTELDSLVQHARQEHADLGTSKQARAEVLIRQGVCNFIKEADDAAAATATAERTVFRVPTSGFVDGIEVLGIRYSPDGAVTADAANNATISFYKRDGVGGGRTLIGSYTSDIAGGSLTAHVPKAFTLSATIADRQVVAGGVITQEITKAGTGVVLQAGCFTIVYNEL